VGGSDAAGDRRDNGQMWPSGCAVNAWRDSRSFGARVGQEKGRIPPGRFRGNPATKLVADVTWVRRQNTSWRDSRVLGVFSGLEVLPRKTRRTRAVSGVSLAKYLATRCLKSAAPWRPIWASAAREDGALYRGVIAVRSARASAARSRAARRSSVSRLDVGALLAGAERAGRAVGFSSGSPRPLSRK